MVELDKDIEISGGIGIESDADLEKVLGDVISGVESLEKARKYYEQQRWVPRFFRTSWRKAVSGQEEKLSEMLKQVNALEACNGNLNKEKLDTLRVAIMHGVALVSLGDI